TRAPGKIHYRSTDLSQSGRAGRIHLPGRNPIGREKTNGRAGVPERLPPMTSSGVHTRLKPITAVSSLFLLAVFGIPGLRTFFGATPGDEGDKLKAILRSEEHTSELQSRENLVCRLLLEKKK